MPREVFEPRSRCQPQTHLSTRNTGNMSTAWINIFAAALTVWTAALGNTAAAIASAALLVVATGVSLTAGKVTRDEALPFAE